MKKVYETINNIRVEVIRDPNGELSCSECCFKGDDESCSVSMCYTPERDVFFKLAEDEVVPTDVQQYMQDFLEYVEDDKDYYKSVCDSVGNLLGIAAYTSDDGSIQDSVLVAKLEELVAELVLENVKLKSKVRSLEVLGN